MALWSTQALREINTMELSEGIGRLARKADNHSAICQQSLDFWQVCVPPRPITGRAFTEKTDIITLHETFIE
jgi:hypothetical protein